LILNPSQKGLLESISSIGVGSLKYLTFSSKTLAKSVI